MTRIYASTVIPAPVNDVWALAGDWAGISNWHPAVDASRLGDGPAASEAGATRRCTLANGAALDEVQTARSDTDHTYSYTITDGPLPMQHHAATVRLSPITDTGQTFAEWTTDFDAADAVHGDIHGMLSEALPGGLAALKAKFV